MSKTREQQLDDLLTKLLYLDSYYLNENKDDWPLEVVDRFITEFKRVLSSYKQL